MSERKKINELTEEEGKEILKFVYPNDDDYFQGLSFEPEITEEGQYVTFGMRSIVGILFHNGQDNCILHFDNSKVVLWLYQHGYDIEDLLKENAYFSQFEKDMESLTFVMYQLAQGEESFREGSKHNWTLEYVQKRCADALSKYYYKDYE